MGARGVIQTGAAAAVVAASALAGAGVWGLELYWSSQPTPDTAASTEVLERYLSRRPLDLVVLEELSFRYRDAGRYGDALEMYLRAAEDPGAEAQALFEAARMAAYLGRADECALYMRLATRAGFRRPDLVRRDRAFSATLGERMQELLLREMTSITERSGHDHPGPGAASASNWY